MKRKRNWLGRKGWRDEEREKGTSGLRSGEVKRWNGRRGTERGRWEGRNQGAGKKVERENEGKKNWERERVKM